MFLAARPRWKATLADPHAAPDPGPRAAPANPYSLEHITARPGKIGDIARAALVLTRFEHGYLT